MVVKNITFKSQASFKRQLVSFFVVSISLLAILTSIITAWQTSQQIRQSTIETGIQVTKNFSDQSVLALLTDSKENGQEAADRVLGFNSVSGVAVYKVGGELLTSSSKSVNHSFFLDQSKLTNSTQLIEESNDLWLFSAPVYFVDDEFDPDMVDPNDESVESQLLGYVLVEYNKQALHVIQRSIFINNFVIGGVVAIILSIVMSIGITQLTKPLSALSQTMETARDSSIYPKAQVSGASDIRQMAEMYNQMMTHLEKQNTAMEKYQSTLESEVEMRTLELKVARDTALTASRHKSEFLANISHELRTPLQAIIGYTDLVKEDLELECMDAQVEDLEKSIRAAHNLLGLINNILDLAKIEAGKMDLYVKPTDTEYLINDTIETVLPMAAANNNKLIVEKGDLSETLILDRQKLMQVFLNLLSNACKFTKMGK